MINIVVQSKARQAQATNVVVPTSFTSSEPTKTLFVEASRRDKIIRSQFAACKYKEGDVVKLTKVSEATKYGHEIQVITIIKNYAQFGKQEQWPENDLPMIVYAKSKDKDLYFFCTVGYLEPL